MRDLRRDRTEREEVGTRFANFHSDAVISMFLRANVTRRESFDLFHLDFSIVSDSNIVVAAALLLLFFSIFSWGHPLFKADKYYIVINASPKWPQSHEIFANFCRSSKLKRRNKCQRKQDTRASVVLYCWNSSGLTKAALPVRSKQSYRFHTLISTQLKWNEMKWTEKETCKRSQNTRRTSWCN